MKTKIITVCGECSHVASLAEASRIVTENGLIVEHSDDLSEVFGVTRSHPRCECADPDCMHDHLNLIDLVRERRAQQRAA